VILHLLPRGEWEEVKDGEHYLPDTFAVDGFVHCSGDDDVMLAVANRYYAGVGDDLLVLTLDEDRLGADVRWEAPDPAPPPGVDPATRFPHVYGPIELDAVVRVRRLRRSPDGAFAGYEAID
jgi:uncharacterized protein (DUF952 family)